MKIAFITGGVVSSLGKGIIGSSLGRLLEDGGVNVGMMKCDPYLNVDPGTMSPIEHGEVFVTEDGGETDLDLGHYERFLGKNFSKDFVLTSGSIYKEVLERERKGFYEGKTVQVIPHVTDLIKEKIYNNAKKYDLLIVEIGGSVGDIESLAYTEVIRQVKFELGQNCTVIHAGYVPLIKVSNELKTKPIQRSIQKLRELGVYPSFIVTRSEVELSKQELNKIAMFGNVYKERIFQCIDIDSIYRIPLLLEKQGFDKNVSKYLELNIDNSDHKDITEFINKLDNPKYKVNIAIIGKYTENKDSYISIIEALKHASVFNNVELNYKLINSKEDYNPSYLSNFDGILVAGGFGKNGVNGKIKAIQYARENNIPFLGICYGMQLAALEFAKNVANLNVVHGENEDGNKIIDIMNDMKNEVIGGTMRLGNYGCEIKKDTLAYRIYNSYLIYERHRHRYEFNNEYKTILEQKGLVFSGVNPETNLIEIIEYPINDFFIAVQYHPELSSKITKPNKLFNSFIKATK